MRAVDAAIIAAVEARGVTMHNADVPTEQNPLDPDVRVITVEFPYTVLYSNLGDDNPFRHTSRLSGRASRRSVFFQVTSVGTTVDQAKWAAERQRRALSGKRLVVDVWDEDTGEPTGEKLQTGLVNVSESQRVRRDDTATDPEGKPVFYLVDIYTLPVSITPLTN